MTNHDFAVFTRPGARLRSDPPPGRQHVKLRGALGPARHATRAHPVARSPALRYPWSSPAFSPAAAWASHCPGGCDAAHSRPIVHAFVNRLGNPQAVTGAAGPSVRPARDFTEQCLRSSVVRQRSSRGCTGQELKSVVDPDGRPFAGARSPGRWWRLRWHSGKPAGTADAAARSRMARWGTPC